MAVSRLVMQNLPMSQMKMKRVKREKRWRLKLGSGRKSSDRFNYKLQCFRRFLEFYSHLGWSKTLILKTHFFRGGGGGVVSQRRVANLPMNPPLQVEPQMLSRWCCNYDEENDSKYKGVVLFLYSNRSV